MIDEYIKEKLYNSVCMIHLYTGETIVCLVYSRDDSSITVYFPYTVYKDGKIDEHNPNALDRRFTISILGYIYAKAPNRRLSDKFFEAVMTDHTEEFKRFILKFTETVLSREEVPEEVPKDKVLH